jgi:hypothetical protein
MKTLLQIEARPSIVVRLRSPPFDAASGIERYQLNMLDVENGETISLFRWPRT